MKTKFKKIAAAGIASAIMGTCVGCGSSTAYAFTIDGVQINAGMYIYYSYAAYSEAISTIQSQNEELDTNDDKLVKEQFIDGVDTLTWIQNKAKDYCAEYVAVQKQCEELEITLTDEKITEVNDYVEQAWEANGKTFASNGISEESVKKILLNTYLTEDLFYHYYDIDGSEGVNEDEVKDYFIENNARVRYITFNLTDGSGDLLKEDGKEEMKKMVDGYLKAAQALNGDEEALREEFDSIQEEYNAYVTSISEEAVAATATSETDEDGNEIPPVTTTTTEEITTTTTTGTEATTTVAAENNKEENNETTATTILNSRSTTLSSDESSEVSTDESVENGETTEETTTTTTTSPYANERIIAKVTTSEDTKEEDITYTPSKKAYEEIFKIEKYNEPFVVYDEEAYYLVVRMDITDRMTEDDLWSEDNVDSVITQMYKDKFDDKVDEWSSDLNIEENKRAIKRYDPFEIDFSSQS